MKRNNFIILTIGIVIGLSLLSFVAGFFSVLSVLESFRVVFGSVFVLFLPGFVWSFVFFDIGGEKKIDLIERIALSFALSIAIVPLTVFYLNLIGMKISALSSFIVVLVLIGAGFFVMWWKSRRKSPIALR